MYASDYPHYESWFPDSVDKIMAWDGIKPDTRQRLFWDNAARCFKET
jgi:predicted TIM-barrel fold metal-dependent hydrolase